MYMKQGNCIFRNGDNRLTPLETFFYYLNVLMETKKKYMINIEGLFVSLRNASDLLITGQLVQIYIKRRLDHQQFYAITNESLFSLILEMDSSLGFGEGIEAEVISNILF